uniref:Uncharacterized protein n=1 Tax=Bracon brevicornis TaxID=1563983 RepID=A0A6V7KDH9_9HYME
MPMTEPHTYTLSTAENELGVVVAHSDEGLYTLHYFIYILRRKTKKNLCFPGISMVPISWTEMQCPKTLTKEFRKVAKVVPEHVITET